MLLPKGSLLLLSRPFVRFIFLRKDDFNSVKKFPFHIIPSIFHKDTDYFENILIQPTNLGRAVLRDMPRYNSYGVAGST